MRVGNGAPGIDGVQVGEITIDVTTPAVSLSVKYAYVNSKTQRRYGYNHKSTWSEAALLKLREFLDALEEDIVSDVFGETASSGGGVAPADTSDGIPGL